MNLIIMSSYTTNIIFNLTEDDITDEIMTELTSINENDEKKLYELAQKYN